MEPNEILKSGGEGFIDRSKVRILLCDNDMKSSVEVYDLLSKCSYQGIKSLFLAFCCSLYIYIYCFDELAAN
jgi:hypothetical protein